MSAQVIFPFSHTGFAENLADPINQYGKGTTSYILRGIPFCLWVAFTSFRKTWHKGQLLEDRGTEMTARGIQVKQKDSSVRGVIFRDLTWLAGSICWSQIVMILLLGQEHEHGKTQYIPGKQVMVRSWLWKTYKQTTLTWFLFLVKKESDSFWENALIASL